MTKLRRACTLLQWTTSKDFSTFMLISSPHLFQCERGIANAGWQLFRAVMLLNRGLYPTLDWKHAQHSPPRKKHRHTSLAVALRRSKIQMCSVKQTRWNASVMTTQIETCIEREREKWRGAQGFDQLDCTLPWGNETSRGPLNRPSVENTYTQICAQSHGQHIWQKHLTRNLSEQWRNRTVTPSGGMFLRDSDKMRVL